LFAKRVRAFVKRSPRTIANIEDVRQLVKSSGSVGANYIEANEASIDEERNELIQESTELMSIFGAIVRKCE